MLYKLYDIKLQVNKTDVDERTALHWAAYQVIFLLIM